MDSKNTLRQLTKDDLRMITPFLDFVGRRQTPESDPVAFPVPDEIVMPLTAALADPNQVELMLKLFNEEPHHTRLLAVRNAQDEDLVLIPDPQALAVEMHKLKQPKK